MDDGGAFVNDIDCWIQRLYDFKPLTENEVKVLCDKVSTLLLTLLL